MNRRAFVRDSLMGFVGLSGPATRVRRSVATVLARAGSSAAALEGSGVGQGASKLFPTDLPESQWVKFRAAGFAEPACGVIYRLATPATCGMPLGGIDTGCLDLETSGLWGYCTIFNSRPVRVL